MSTLRLVPGLRWFRREETHVQFGVDQRRAVIVDVGEPGLIGLLDLFDGSRDEGAYLREARKSGADPLAAAELLRVLREAGVVVDSAALLPPFPLAAAPVEVREGLVGEAAAISLRRKAAPGTPAEMLRARAAARVLVDGTGPLVELVAGQLRASGVGKVWTDGSARRARPTFAVLVDVPQPAGLLAFAYARRDLPHLAVTRRDGTVCVGPLVVPSRTACLNCVDLWRRDRDPRWGTVVAHTQTTAPAVEYLETPVRLIAAGVIAAQVLSHVDGARAAAVEGTIDVNAPGEVRRSGWAPHPACGCGVVALSVEPPTAGP
ncbi:hypothetical protein [Phytomonospora endophytica]|uniref:Bacteriocin biosynthesis cyclodehydratase domain-containing protein n=1 Tax=Phytomonospora endophytica TaxID=714109 RepID=A0A841FIA4_9ACTN|nr:hypothetical protein [Phytomonospora endophytica]MBB6035936.1 bacteriocin biosynthesis cyclodehydratase domain-containing protein [Phytomonospora endophytica]